MIFSEIVYLDSDNKILIEVQNGRTIKLTFNANPLEIVYEKKKITGIKINGEHYLKLGELEDVFVTINDKLHTYKIRDIEKVDENCFLVHTMPRTKSSLFITPMISDSAIDLRWTQYFVNTYTEFNESEKNYKIYILYRFFNSEDYKRFEHSLKKNKYFVSMKDYDLQHVVFEFRVPEEYVEDFKMFHSGKYSKMSVDYKYKILKFLSLSSESVISKILFKEDSRRKQLELELGVSIPYDVELYDIPDDRERLYDR